MSPAFMASRFLLVVPLLAAVAAPAPAADPGGGGCDTCNVVSEKALSLDLAQAIAQGALAKCRADGNHVSVTVLDRDGLLKIAFRDNGAGPHTIVTSRRKAFTSVTFKQLSGQWAHRVLTDPAIAGLKDTAGTIALGGGVPIKAGTEVIGAIGVSGSPGADKDEACANAGIAGVADKLK
ncbi:MAG TPA: heme-binding protein [Stellaceae bacterium]|jgi:uncharacterized protein GlcG (DUF336 family)|nr:heme-binding protein [Stellaceae bacterium]